MTRQVFTFICGALLTIQAAIATDRWTEAFDIDWISTPARVDPQIGGIDALPDGRLAICFHRGEVFFYDPSTDQWSLFALGLHEPLGIVAESPSSLVVMQRPELTRLRDTDGDGRADRYETLYDGFGMSGNYHEFAFGPARDRDGHFYIALNTASNRGGIYDEIRGEWSPLGPTRAEMEREGADDWPDIRRRAGRMYARVPYRGWIIRVSPDGKKVTPYASGLRSPDGIGFDAEGRLLVTDNQGDWRGTSPLYHIEEGKFYGHPASLVWEPGWDRDPVGMDPKVFDQLRTPAVGLFPQGELANSPTQPVAIPAGAFGPFAGQTIIGEMNQPTLIRFLPDPVDGFAQGALIPFIQTHSLGIGNHRLAFTPDGSLWVGRTHLTWAGAEGLSRIRLKDPEPFAVQEIKLLRNGFQLRFSQPLDPARIDQVAIRSHRYNYSANYGSPKADQQTLELTRRHLSDDGLTLSLETPDLRQGHLHTLLLHPLRSRSGKPLLGDVAYYQLVKKR